jgi:hypothetical protein
MCTFSQKLIWLLLETLKKYQVQLVNLVSYLRICEGICSFHNVRDVHA